MQSVQQSLFARDDTFFGVCEALGEDFGFNANWLRVALAGLLFWNPMAVILGYIGAGVLVALSRFAAPAPRVAILPEAQASAPAEEEQPELPELVEPERLAA